jgi:hypothetical protein
MTGWSNDELTGIGTAEELQISPRRRDGNLRNPRTIWVVRAGDDLYVRSVRRRTSSVRADSDSDAGSGRDRMFVSCQVRDQQEHYSYWARLPSYSD